MLLARSRLRPQWSTFNALTVEADVAVTANVDITTDVGALLIDADDDNNAVQALAFLP